MGKDPAILFYTADFLVDCLTMNNEEAGMYIRLLCLQHQKGPLTKEQMIIICGEENKEVFSHFVQNEDGLFYNENLEEERERRRKYSQSRSENRKKQLKNKDNNNTIESYDNHMLDIKNSYDYHMETETVTVNNNDFNKLDIENNNIVNVTNSNKKKDNKWNGIADEELLKLLKDFEEMRSKIKKPLTERSRKMIITKLNKNFPKDKWVDVIEQSINHCWADIYPIKADPQQKNQQKRGDNDKNINEFWGNNDRSAIKAWMSIRSAIESPNCENDCMITGDDCANSVIRIMGGIDKLKQPDACSIFFNEYKKLKNGS